MNAALPSGVVAILCLVAACGAWAVESGPPEGTPEPGTGSSRDDLEEVEEVLRDLDEAGVPPTREELTRFLESVQQGEIQEGAGKSSLPFHGLLLVRSGHYRDEGWDQYGKLALESGPVRLRARYRQYRTGVRDVTGAVAVEYGPVEARMGKIGFGQGFGLLVGPPGRGSSLAADGGFSPSGVRLRSWLGSPDTRAVIGAAGGLRFATWNLRVLAGRQEVAGGVKGPPVGLVQMGAGGVSWRLSGAVFKGDLDVGASLSGGTRTGPLTTHFETMVWRPAPSIPPAGAVMVQVAWAVARGAGFEFQLGAADLAGPPRLASRPAVLPDWAGRGFAARGYTTLNGGIKLRALIHLGSHPDRKGIHGREEKGLVDIQAGKRLFPGTEISVRYRRGTRTRRQWSERYPWQAPRVVATDQRAVLSFVVSADRPHARLRLLVRSFGLTKDSDRGRRSLVGVTGSRTLPKGWKVKGAWVTAWGDPIDLVSAVSPLTTMVLPRHWGHWRSETVLGLEWARRGVRLQAAGSWRSPDPAGAESSARALWVQGGFDW